MEQSNQCAYKELDFYQDRCNKCNGEPDCEICYTSMQELKEHLARWDCMRLEDQVGSLL